MVDSCSKKSRRYKTNTSLKNGSFETQRVPFKEKKTNACPGRECRSKKRKEKKRKAPFFSKNRKAFLVNN